MSWELGTIAVGLAGYSVLHSVLAAARVQRAFERLGASPRTYRIGFNVVAVVLLLVLSPLLRHDFPVVWRARGLWRVLLLVVQVAACAGFLYAFRGIDVREFMGLRAKPRGGVPALQTRGAYALCRHPVYFFMGLFFSAWPVMDAGLLVVAVWIWAYAWIGSIFEERRLAAEFGSAYRAYQATHWRLLPFGPRSRRHDRSTAAPAS